jgi:hypothetical protein
MQKAKMIVVNKAWWIRSIACCCIVTGVLSCNQYKKNSTHRDIPDSNISKGKKLAQVYCASCHVLPEPSLLDASHWENGVLPAMGPRLGIFSDRGKTYPSSRYDMELEKGYYPSKAALSMEEWHYIIDYYTALSPDTLGAQERKYRVEANAGLFEVKAPTFKEVPPITCMVTVDTTVMPRQLLIGDMVSRNILRYDNTLLVIDSFKALSPVVDVDLKTREFITCNIGIMNPNNGKYGTARKVKIDDRGKMRADTGFGFEKLARPVQVSSADFNKDGRMDYLVCEFGNLTGALSWMENKGDNHFERHVLRPFPGAIKAYIRDVNNDGLPDIWVLFAQGDESIFLFTNKGNGQFEQRQVLRFPSIYGSSYFELADINRDGFADIVYTCGDNADFSTVLKPYHGIYIYLNDGKNNFKQVYFFPMYGCFKAMARDFDGDGDLDMAAISFFADYARHPEESVLYLENLGNMDFKPYSIPNTNSGRWLTMDAGDVDGDGKTDLVIGNFSAAPASLRSGVDWQQGPAFLFLKNIIKK